MAAFAVIKCDIACYWSFKISTLLGEHGSDVSINKDSLPAEEKEKFDQGWQKNAFNQYASDKISVHRTLPDVRDHE